MLGLKRGTVKLLPHNISWVKEFEREKKRLLSRLGDSIIDIQHIGSTAIPNIPAKPMIDILVGINSMRNRAKFIKPLEALGYKWRKDVARPNKQLFFMEGPESKITHRLQLKKYKGAPWNADILFRDYLRKNKKRARQYAQLKRRLADKYANDIGKYMGGKAQFIGETIEIARRSRS